MNKKGQALVEYILIIALVSVLAIALVNYFGGYLLNDWPGIRCW